MPDQPIKYNSQLEKDEHDDSANVGAKRVILFGWNSSTLQYERLTSSSGVLNTAGGGAAGTNASVGANAAAIPTSSTLVGLKDGGGNLQPISAANPVPISGSITATNPSVGTAGVAIPTSNTLIGGSDGTNLQPLQVDASKNLKTIINAPLPAGSNAIGSITNTAFIANAGTNLNTSALALEAGHLATIDTSTAKIPAQGQALAAASMPVVLPVAQITTLTPPAAITGFALEAGNLATIAGIISAAKAAVKTADGDIATLGNKADAASIATDATAISMMSVLKQISKTIQAPASTPVTGTFYQATQPVSLASLPTLASGTNTIGYDTPTPATGGQALNKLLLTAVSGAKATIKTIAGNLYGLHLYNPNTSVVYVQLFNKIIANITLGTTVPDDVLIIPAGGILDDLSLIFPINYTIALSYAITTTATGAVNPTTGITGMFYYL